MSFDPKIVEARLALDLIASADMPSIAVEAMEAGLDGPAIRRLAVLDKPTYFELRDVRARAVEEMGLQEVSRGHASLRLAAQIAKDALDRKDYFKPLHELYWLWKKAGYTPGSGGVGSTYGTLYDDVGCAQYMGESDDQIREWVRERLEEVVRYAAEAERGNETKPG